MSRVLLVLALLSALAAAGGGPETTLLVVNRASPLSRRVANEYVKLRDIPPSHVFHLDSVPHFGVVKLDYFLEQMWRPVRAYMDEQGIADQIELIAWSADFPYAVDFSARLGGQRHQGIGRHASLTGLVYLMGLVEDERVFWDATRPVNKYFGVGVARRGAGRAMTKAEFALLNSAERATGRKAYADAAKAYAKLLATYDHLDRHWYNYACALALAKRPQDALAALRKAVACGWRGAGHTLQDPDLESLRELPAFKAIVAGMSRFATNPARAFVRTDGHLLSVQLAYTGRFGNSLPEVLGYLRAARKSDFTKPTGTVYICQNGNVRSTTRMPYFASTMKRLEAMGRKVELLDKTVLPGGKPDVVGAVVGSAGFSWAKSKSRMLPGAICEHLTSFGAHFGTPGQTKISEFLRHGAAGSSGTVQEPLALWQKFPLPFIHVYYGEGLSLAEAFFYSVHNPYQLMVAGDGLARPFAESRDVKVKAPPSPWKGIVKLETDADELWIDGRRVDSFEVDTTRLDDGYHDVRAVGFSQGAVKTRSYRKIKARVDNRGRTVKVVIRKDEIRIDAPGAREFTLAEGTIVVATSNDGKLTLERLVPGPVKLVPRVRYPDGSAYRCEPIELDVPARPLVPAAKEPPTLPGLRGHYVDDAGKPHPVIIVNLGDRFAGPRLADQLPKKGVKEVVLDGYFEIKAAGHYQLICSSKVPVGIETRGVVASAIAAGPMYFVLACERGWHEFKLSFKPSGRPDLEVNLGGDQVFAPLTLRHRADPAPRTRPTVDSKPDSINLAWKSTVKDIASVTLFPGKGAKDLPRDWVVETNTGYGKWKPVKELSVLVAPGLTTNAKQPKPPQFLQLRFAKVRARKIRLKPKAPANVGEIMVGLATR